MKSTLSGGLCSPAVGILSMAAFAQATLLVPGDTASTECFNTNLSSVVADGVFDGRGLHFPQPPL